MGRTERATNVAVFIRSALEHDVDASRVPLNERSLRNRRRSRLFCCQAGKRVGMAIPYSRDNEAGAFDELIASGRSERG